MTGLQLMALIENIPLNFKNSMRSAINFFIILPTSTSGMPTSETCFLSGQLRWLLLRRFN